MLWLSVFVGELQIIANKQEENVMNTLTMFYQAAEKAFQESGLEGDLQGIKVKDEKVYFVYNVPTWQSKETLWQNASGAWEGICRSLRNMNR